MPDSTSIPEDDDYHFSPSDITSPDETFRRWAVIDISKHKMRDYEDVLLQRYCSEESYDLKRHIVRALGNIGGEKTCTLLVAAVRTEQGLILGEIAEAIGKLRIRDAIPDLLQLEKSPVSWVSQKARWALRRVAPKV
jgi:hypothetical protein